MSEPLHVLVTTVGAAPQKEKVSYSSVKYQFDSEQPREGKFFSILLCDFLEKKGKPVQKAIVLLTEGTKSHPNWQGTADEKGLRGLLEEREIGITPVDIPDGRNETELWTIFDAISKNVPQGATVTLDITHGFRSLPYVMLLACAYLEVSGKFDLANVYYGAFVDANTVAQAVDLTPMLTLFEWANAVDAFKRGGNLRQMAKLLGQNADLQRGMGGIERDLSYLAARMKNLTEALELGRLRNIATPVREIRSKAKAARKAAQIGALPFVDQIDAILDELKRFEVSLDEQQDVRQWLVAQFRLTEWYTEKKHYMQAALLLHELIISFAASQMPEFSGKSAKNIYEEREIRTKAEEYLNQMSQKSKELGKVVKLAAELAEQLSGLPDGLRKLVVPDLSLTLSPVLDLQGIWDSATQLRNTVAHLGHHKDDRKAKDIEDGLKEILNSLRPLIMGRASEESAAPPELTESSESAPPAE